MKSSSPSRVAGIVPPVPTPFLENGSIDTAAIHRIARHLEAGGIDAAFLLGSTGELASIGHADRLLTIRTAGEAYKIPFIVGIGDNCVDESLALADAAAAAGAAALVLNAPSYYELSAREMRSYLDRIVPKLPLPLFLYNMPWLTGHSFDRDTIRHALQFPGLIGFKDSSGDLGYMEMLIEESSARPETSVLAGNEFIFLDSLRLGAHGVVGAGANIYPEIFRSLLDAWLAGDVKSAEARQEKINALGKAIFSLTGNPTSGFATCKAALAVLGLCEPTMASPVEACSPQITGKIAALLKNPAAA